MQTIFVCLLILSSLVSSKSLLVTPTSIPGNDGSALTALMAELNNFTLGIPKPPPEFEVTFEIGGPTLRITSCLMNAVAALKDLALGDWDGKITDETEYRLDNYPEVSIIITTAKRQRKIQSCFVTWAVCLGLYEMIHLKKFEFAQFEMTWQGQVLGWVHVVNHPPRAGLSIQKTQANQTLNHRATLPSANRTIELEPVNITNVITTNDADNPAEARLIVSFEFYGDILSVYDVFVPVMSALTDMAQIPNNLESAGLRVGVDGFKGYICALPAYPPRTSPPYLNYGWLIRAVARIPAYMLDKGRFGTVTMILAVDGVTVGFGRLSTAPDCDGDAVLPASGGVAEN